MQVAHAASAMSDSEDDMPLAQRVHSTSHHNDSDDEDDQPLANRQFTHKPSANGNGAASHGEGASTAVPASQTAATVADMNGWDSSSSDDVPLGKAQ